MFMSRSVAMKALNRPSSSFLSNLWRPRFQIMMSFSALLSPLSIAILYHQQRPPDSVTGLLELPPVEVKENDACVKMLAAPINPSDINRIEGVYPVRPPVPAVGGYGDVGEVHSVGSAVKDLSPCDWVIPSPPSFGTWQTYIVQDHSVWHKIDKESAMEYAATITVSPLAALRTLGYFTALNSGDSVVRNGVASIVGQCIIQIAKFRGIHSINILRDSYMPSLLLRVGRLVPSCKGRQISRLQPLLKAHCYFFSTATKSWQVTTDGLRNEKEDIDFNLLFQSCKELPHAKRLHALLVVSGKTQDIFVSTKLVNLYAYLGEVSLSRRTFDQIPKKNVFTCNSMISAYVRHGRFHEAVDCFHQLLTCGLQPDFYTFPPVVKACQNLHDSKKMHCLILKLGFEVDVFVAASLIHMYSRFGFIDAACKLFNNMPIRDGGLWNAMISGYCQTGNVTEALDIVNEMRLEGVAIDGVTAASILPICAQLDDILSGKLIHSLAIKHGMEFELFVSNALINFYAKFGSLGPSQKVFDQMVRRDIVSWNSIIAAYEQNDDVFTALSFFYNMQKVGIQPDLLTVVSLASIVARLNDHKKSRSIHGFVMRKGWFIEYIIIGNSLVDMYAKMGATDSACAVFESLPIKDVISWNSLITGYAQNGLASEAIEAYSMMEKCETMVPNQGTWVSILLAYSHIGALQQGMRIHGQVLKNSLYLDVYVGTCLIDMYGKCGKLDDAMSLFYEMPRKDSVPWNAIISCIGVHGHGVKALNLFREMIAKGVKPDHITFTSLLSACSHSGLVSDGQRCFHMMQEEYGIKPSLKHYGCMVDLFGRAGHLKTAYNFIKDMPIQPDASMWGALVGACRIHGNTELGKYASDRLFELDSENVGYYVLLSNIFSTVGKWEGADKVRSLARGQGLRKTPGWSSIEMNNKVDVFYTGNKTHPKYEDIHNELRDLTVKIKNIGYVPDVSFVLQDVEDDEKEQILTAHSERLAIAYGIISSPPKTLIRIFKNLRVCGDCHTATKFIAQITEREIIVRDSNRFHHFKNGICSCGDYW